MSKPKIICIGFHKTGTTSLSDALGMLAFPIAHASNIFHELSADSYDFDRMKTIAEDTPFRGDLFDALCAGVDETYGIQDSPSVFFYKEFAEKYSNAKFIFTTRSEDAWLNSLKGFVPNKTNPLRRYMYGVRRLSGNEDVLRDVFRKTHADIRAYFAGNPNFKEFDIGKGELSWENLLEFLGEDFYPDLEHIGALSQPFPKSNVNAK